LVGPALGGLLSEPAHKYPTLFPPGSLFATFPYLLPCLAVAAVTAVVFVTGAFVIRETLSPQLRAGYAVVEEPDADGGVRKQRSARGGDGAKGLGEDGDAAVVAQAGHADLHADGPSELSGTTSSSALQTVEVHGEGDEDGDHDTDARPGDDSYEAKHGAERDTGGLIAAAGQAAVDARPLAIAKPKPVDVELTAVGASSRVQSAAAQRRSAPPPVRSCQQRVLQRLCADSSTRRLMHDRAVLATTTLYAGLSLVGIVSAELYPIYALNDADHGGFGWSSSDIGLMATYCGLPLILYQAFVYSRLVARIGLLNTLKFTLAATTVLLASTPLCSLAVHSPSWVQWTVLTTNFIVSTLARVSSFTCIFVLIANAALPADRGKVNGIGQAAASMVRAVGPPIGTAIFAWSVSDRNMAAGWPWNYSFTWYIMTIISLGTLGLCYVLPPWIERKREAVGPIRRSNGAVGGGESA